MHDECASKMFCTVVKESSQGIDYRLSIISNCLSIHKLLQTPHHHVNCHTATSVHKRHAEFCHLIGNQQTAITSRSASAGTVAYIPLPTWRRTRRGYWERGNCIEAHQIQLVSTGCSAYRWQLAPRGWRSVHRRKRASDRMRRQSAPRFA